jgi:hypothetical protein
MLQEFMRREVIRGRRVLGCLNEKPNGIPDQFSFVQGRKENCSE